MLRDLLVVSYLLLSLLQGLAVREKRDYDTCDSVDELLQACTTKYKIFPNKISNLFILLMAGPTMPTRRITRLGMTAPPTGWPGRTVTISPPP